jgi:hypothetical protein
MSRPKKCEKRYRTVKRTPESLEAAQLVYARHAHGSTEKILRRNRRIWERALAKLRRSFDKRAITESIALDNWA